MIASRKTAAAPGQAPKAAKEPGKHPAEPAHASPQPPASEIPRPVDVADGIPDRSSKSGKRVYVVIAAVFLAWLAFLVYCAAAGRL